MEFLENPKMSEPGVDTLVLETKKYKQKVDKWAKTDNEDKDNKSPCMS